MPAWEAELHMDAGVPEGGVAAGSRRVALWWPLAVAAVACLAICAVLAAAAQRGDTYDEYWSIYYADPRVPLGVAWAQIWPGDTNPPFFYFLARLWQELTGPGLLARRLINLPPLAFLLAWFFSTARRYPARRPLLAGLALLAFTSKFFLLHFPEYRGYFWQYCAELVFLGAASIAYLERDRRPDLFQLIALPVLIDFHLVTALFTGVLLVPLLMADLRRRNDLRVACLSVVALLAMVPMGGFYIVLHAHQLQSVAGRMSWVTPRGPLDALWTIASHLIPGLGENWVALLIAVGLLVRPVYRPRGLPVGLIRLIGGAAGASLLIALIINSRAPLVVDRYFSFLAVEVIFLLGLSVVPVLLEYPRLAALATANGFLYLLFSSMTVTQYSGWQDDAATVAHLAAQCPQTRIYAGSLPQDPAEQVGLAELAGQDHLVLLPLGPDAPGACPVIYWTQHGGPSKAQIAQHGGDIVSAANDSAGFGIEAADLARTRAIRTREGKGIILVVAAPARG